MAFFYVHYVLIYQTVTSLTYVFVPLDFRPLECQDLILLQNKHYFLLERKSHYGFFQKHN
ncbi:hypothetical protein E0401_11195 [Escherichia coli]|nr:hypothetical protein [Escherichia coli]EFA4943358.1 hypothetical protein [Escherichia coli]EFA5471447.1 hypothetical protein [Escherichia coli]EFA5495720.1 hypothetical protein [Escherichia coli]EFA5504648.1 hypothetical protein [Escherichia coli]